MHVKGVGKTCGVAIFNTIAITGMGLVIMSQQGQINNLRRDVDALVKSIDDNDLASAVWKEEQTKRFAGAMETNLKTTRDAHDELSGRVLTVETVNQALSNKLGGFENTSSKLNGRITNLEKKPVTKTDDQRRIEMVQKVLPSVVDITALTPHGRRFMTGGVINDRKGNLVILTCGHYVNSENEFLKTTFQIHVNDDYNFEINGARMKNGLVPWSSVNHRDVSIIRLTDEMQALLRKYKIQSIPILTATSLPKQGSEIVAIGKEGNVMRGTLNRPHYYEWQGRKRSDIQTDAPIKRGDSGGPILNLDGEMVGIASWGYKPDVKIAGPKELAGKLKVEVDALTGIHYFISNADILRALGSFGCPLTNDERNHLLKIDVLEDRPYLLSPPVALGQNINVPLLTYLGQLSGLDGYAFQK